MKRPRRVIALTVTGLGLAASLALSGCSSDDTPEASDTGGPRVVAPGEPGEPAKTLTADEAKQARRDDSPNSADFAYVQMMIVHHRQALVMTGLAGRHADDKQVSRVAERIAAAQRPEIGAMDGWLSRYGGPREQQGHQHAEMPGMATASELGRLRKARGTQFDELFLKLMIAHHNGAVTMATDALSEGNNVLVEEMANDVIAQQSAEIARMQKMREGTGD
ncbi:DUF305 domain-containing protein [Streptomyces sp. NPDC048248]|uniref:DUF305 domain-containing protein n=1 Tax=Streptomyces sp. NPDC048248 TaxID=3365523 RepID=UPI00372291C4